MRYVYISWLYMRCDSVLQAVALNEAECEWEQSRDDRVVPSEGLSTSSLLSDAAESIKSLAAFSDEPAYASSSSKVENIIGLFQLRMIAV